MARKATKDTFAIEEVGGVEVRRQVIAGDMVPDSYQLEEGAFEETENKQETRVGNGGGEEPQAAYGDSPDPAQQEQAEEQQSEEQQESAQSPAGKQRAGRNK